MLPSPATADQHFGGMFQRGTALRSISVVMVIARAQIYFGCDRRNLKVLSVTLTLSEVLFIYNKQLLIKIIARSSSHLSSVLVIMGIQRVGY